MSRCLHITINESSGAAPQRATVYPAARTGVDLDSSYGMTRIDGIDDPKDPIIMPSVDDPKDPIIMPSVDNPDGLPSFRAAGPNGSGAAVATLRSSTTSFHAGPAAPGNPFVRPRDYSGFVIVRMAPGFERSDAKNLWTLAHDHALTGLKAVLELPVKAKKANEGSDVEQPPEGALVSGRLIDLQGQESQCLNRIRDLEQEAARTALPPLHSLTAYWRLDLRKHPALVKKAVSRLNRLPEVDLAYRELTAGDPETPVVAGQLFAEDQGYLADAPAGIGVSRIGTSLVQDKSPQKRHLTLCDLEQGWTIEHRELKAYELSKPIYGDNRADDEAGAGHHGTAVLGIQGAVASVVRFVLASHYTAKTGDALFPGTTGNVAAAIRQALTETTLSGGPLQKGDVLLLEVQRGLLPTEVDEADFDAIRLASALGIIVVEAAGNGGFDLDGYTDPYTRRSLRRDDPGFRDSGAILVGAARASLPHDRMPSSNYGSRVDCFGWGEAVTTCGYGDLAGTSPDESYTNTFSGTSSASAIIASAAALVQARHKEQTEYPLRPLAIRALLSDPATGTHQGPNVPGPIGVMPDLNAILRRRLQLVPDVYMRRHIGDDGSAPGRSEEISSSPDILIWKGQRGPAEDFGEGLRANTPAPGTPIDPSNPSTIYSKGSHLYVRLRNRGVGKEDKAKVQLFASPAATLITPERWMLIGEVDAETIDQGDTLTVSQRFSLNLPARWPQDALKLPNRVVQAYSFLAVHLPDNMLSDFFPGFERTIMLPPGPPYFDWNEFRSFLRGPGVAWRNIHPVRTSDTMTLEFLLAGTPDRARRFDFEVIQRLPAGAKVALKVPVAIAAKLRQGQPWLANGPGDLNLPRRPRTTLSHVVLAPGVYAPATFEVTGANGLMEGHSLAIRQLWRGEEVGRITWWFVRPP